MGTTTDKFDALIRKGDCAAALKLFANEYYSRGKMGHTKKILIERAAETLKAIELALNPDNPRVRELTPDTIKGDIDTLCKHTAYPAERNDLTLIAEMCFKIKEIMNAWK
jgi:hypothetical protein